MAPANLKVLHYTADSQSYCFVFSVLVAKYTVFWWSIETLKMVERKNCPGRNNLRKKYTLAGLILNMLAVCTAEPWTAGVATHIQHHCSATKCSECLHIYDQRMITMIMSVKRSWSRTFFNLQSNVAPEVAFCYLSMGSPLMASKTKMRMQERGEKC